MHTMRKQALEALPPLAYLAVALEEASNDNEKLELAVSNNSLGLVQYYLDRGLDPNMRYNGTPVFYQAVFFENVNLLRLFHQRGIDINLTDNLGRNVAHICIENIYFSIKNIPGSSSIEPLLILLKIVVAWGVNLNQKDNRGKTPLEACKHGDANQRIAAAIKDAKTNDITFAPLPVITAVAPEQLPLSDNDRQQIAAYKNKYGNLPLIPLSDPFAATLEPEYLRRAGRSHETQQTFTMFRQYPLTLEEGSKKESAFLRK